MNELNKDFWDLKYIQKTLGWDLGEVSPPLKNYFLQLKNKSISILIPGCGNSYETDFLLEQGFTNITLIDISPTLTNELKEKYIKNDMVKIICGNFFELHATFDLIIEQTFFCALDLKLREEYCLKIKSLLSKSGKLAGLLFNTIFEKDGPPFGGSKEEYTQLFKKYFIIKTMESCYNSYVKRSNNELFFIVSLK